MVASGHGVKRRLTVHVGTAKAGSTSIQNLLAARWRLLARAGVHVPLAAGGWGPPGAHHGLSRELVDPCGAAGNWARLGQEIRCSASPRFVISCEAFTGPEHRTPCVARLLGLAEREDLEIDVVGYVRPQWQWLESGYAQLARTGETAAPFERYVARMLTAGTRTRLDYNAVFAPFRSAFGDRVRVFALERSRLPRGLLAHFLGALGVDADVRLGRSLSWGNARPGAKDVEVRRRVCVLAGARLPRFARKLLWLPALIDDDAPFAGFDADQIDRFQSRFAGSNARFARDYGIDADGVLFRDTAAAPGRRRNVARWEEFDTLERGRVRRYLMDRTGVDLGAAPGAPAGRWEVRRCLALRGLRVAAALGVGRLATGGFRARRARALKSGANGRQAG